MWVNSGRATKEAASLVAACPAVWEVVFCDLEAAASLVAACPAVWEVVFCDLEAAASLVDVAAAS
jgi:hypothetical protein